ncbi:MAG: PAS-domain containing protein [Pseudobdellovibrionaceae bacterium]
MFPFLSKTANSNKSREDEQLRAFLDGCPAEYIGWDAHGAFLYSPGFAALFGISEFSGLTDLQNALGPSDAAAFENLVSRYERERRPLELTVTNIRERKIRLLLRWGEIAGEVLNILWAEDVTKLLEDNEVLKARLEEARRQEDMMAEALGASASAVVMYGADGEMFWCNAPYAAFFGLDAAEAIATKAQPILKATSAARKIDMQKSVTDALATGQDDTFQATSVISGERKRFDIYLKPLPNKDFVIALYDDKTQDETTQSEGKRTISAYHELLENMQTAVALFDAEQRLNFYNHAFARLWHLEEAYLNGSPKFGDILEKLRESRRLPEQADFRTYKKGWIDRFTNLMSATTDMIVLPDGTVLRGQTIPNPTGGLMMMFEDVTTNLELESSYNTLIAVQRETLDNLSEGVVVVGGDGRVKLYNPTYMELWGLNPEDLDGEPHMSRIADRVRRFFDEERWVDRYDRLVKILQERKEATDTIRRTDGKILSFSAVPLPDGGALFAYTDITDSITVQAALREKNRALETAEKLKTEFLAKVSYQLRTPLNAIIGFNEILAGEFFGPLNEKQKEYTEVISEAGDRLKQLIDDILDLTSIEAGVLELRREKMNLAKLVDSVADIAAEWAMSKQIKLTFSSAPKLGEGILDKQRIRQCLMHLIRNAIEHTPDKGKIKVTATREDDVLELRVVDNGSGIPEEEKERIFRPFEKGVQGMDEGSSASQGGAGLGLSLVKNIVELHGGTIEIEEAKDKGTVMVMRLPVA